MDGQRPATRAMVVLVALLAASAVLDLFFFTGFIASDDVVYTTAGRKLAETGTLWPDLAAHEARLLMVGWCAFVGLLFAQDVQAIAASFVVFHQAVNLLAFGLGRQIGGYAVGLLAAALTATFPLLVSFSTTILPDIPMTACFLAAFLAFRTAYRGEPRPRRSFFLLAVSGGALGLAFLVKESGLVPVPLLLALILVHERRMGAAGGGLRGGLARVVAFLGGLGVVLALEMAALRVVTGVGSSRVGSLLAAPAGAAPSLGALTGRATLLAETVGAHATPAAILLLILLAAGAYTAMRRGFGAILLFPAWFAIYYTWGSSSLAAYSSPSLQLRYLIPCIPFVLVVLAATLAEAYRWVEDRVRRTHSHLEPWLPVAAAIGAAAGLMVQVAFCDRDAGNLYAAPLVGQSLRAMRSWSAGHSTPLVISETLGAQIFPLFRRREGLMFSHEVGPSQLEQWRREGGFHFMDLRPGNPLARAAVNPLLGWGHGLPASERRVESLVESLLAGGGAESGWTMRPAGRFDRVGARSTELRALLGDPEGLSRLRHRPDGGVVVYQLTATDQDVRYPLPPLDPGDTPTIVNGTLEQWSPAGPLGWQTRDTAASRAQGPEGQAAVRIGPGAFSYVWQARPASRSMCGRALVLRAAVRSDVPRAARLWIKLAVGPDWEEVFGDPHPGDGTWHPLEAVVRVPPTFEGGEARFVLLHAGKGQSEFADVEVSVR